MAMGTAGVANVSAADVGNVSLALGGDVDELEELDAMTDAATTKDSLFDDPGCNRTFVVCINNPQEMLDPRSNKLFYEIVVTHAMALLFGVLGNGLVVLVMMSDRKSRSATNLFLVSLAVADLLLLAVYGPLETLRYFVTHWDEAGTVCKLAQFAQLLSAVASVLNLSAVTLERFLVIVFPMRSRSYCTMSNCRRAIFVVWLVAVMLTAPVFLTKGTFPVIYTNLVTNITIYYCQEPGLLFAVYQFVILFGAPGILMIVCYAFVIMELWRSTRNMRVLTNSVSMKNMKSLACRESHNHQRPHSPCSLAIDSPGTNLMPGSEVHTMCTNGHEQREGGCTDSVCTSHHGGQTAFSVAPCRNTARRQNKGDDVRKARKQVIKMLILVVLLFLGCWGPRIIMEIFVKLEIVSFSTATYGTRIAMYILPVIHACVNPFIYSFMSKNFRRSLQRQLEKTGCKRSSTINSMSGIHGTGFGSSRSSRMRRDTMTSTKGFRPSARQRSGRGSTTSSTNCHTDFTKHTEVENVLTAADV